MNNVLQLKMTLLSDKNKGGSGIRNLTTNRSLNCKKVDDIIDGLSNVLTYYDNLSIKIIDGVLFDVTYDDIIAKSNRVKRLFKPKGADINNTIVGARFTDEESNEKHIITYYLDRATINECIQNLKTVKLFLRDQLSDEANAENFNESDERGKKRSKVPALHYGGYLKKNIMRDLIVDCSVIQNIGIPNNTDTLSKDTVLLNFYDTGKNLGEILDRINIDSYSYSSYGKNVVSVSWNIFESIKERIPYLISMISTDISEMEPINKEQTDTIKMTIKDPDNEPVIGVIDTLFDKTVYFGSWVNYQECLEDFERYDIEDDDYFHGTAVSSIIVDGPALNPYLNDNCGNFRVRHFGVCKDKISIPRLVKKIKEIVENNPDIHVWNLSLGTEEEVSKNYISYDSAILDQIQADKNVIFVISGTNDNRDTKKDRLRIGSPADSLNSIVVNSVRRNGEPASYSRKGKVLSFYNKPDVSYYGGDFDEKIKAYSNEGVVKVYGTSLAAPWISRKLCYLIDIIGLPKEVAKALIIDSAAGWNYKKGTNKNKDSLGYGIVPIDIEKILKTDNNEIRFVLYGTSKSYKTASYSIPVPKDKDDYYPYIARATMCYFPKCYRAQGVDYANRELSLKFGRVKIDGGIKDINHNVQDEPDSYVNEKKSRQEFRKWDNTKFISSLYENNRPLKSYKNRLWGFTIISKERFDHNNRNDLKFGIVVTLKEIKNVNRINEFIKECSINNIMVNEIDIENKIRIYNSNQEKIEFE